MENIAMRRYRANSESSGSADSESAVQESAIPEFAEEKTVQRKKEKSAPAEKQKAKKVVKKESDLPVAAQPQSKDVNACADSMGREILSVIQNEMSVDEIAAALSAKQGQNFEIGELLGSLTLLELDGFLCALPGGKYRLN